MNEKLNLHAGSLYKNYLVLKGLPKYIVIAFSENSSFDNDLQWKMYCNDVMFERISESHCRVFFEEEYGFEYFETENPLRDLGFL